MKIGQTRCRCSGRGRRNRRNMEKENDQEGLVGYAERGDREGEERRQGNIKKA